MRDGVPSDSLDSDYTEKLKAERRARIAAFSASRAAQTPVNPAQAPPAAAAPSDMGLGTEIGHGLVRGVAGIGQAVGTGVEVAGIVTRSQRARALGEQMAKDWATLAAKNPKSTAAEGNLWDNPSLLLSPRWMSASVAESVPSLAASMIPAAGAGKFIQVAGKSMRWTPALTLKLARLGAAVTGGAIGGSLEGASTFEQVKAQGGSDSDAVRSSALMGLASAGLNALSVGKMLTPIKGTAGKVLRKGAEAGGWEAITEWLEEPTEALILHKNVLDAMKRGLNVIPASLVTGGAANVVTSAAARGGGGATSTVPGAEQVAPSVQAGPDLTQATEPKKFTPRPNSPQAPASITNEQAARMSPDQIEAAATEMRTYDKTALDAALGDQAKEFDRLERKRHTSKGLTPDEQARFDEFDKRIMADPELARLVYGVGETGLNAEELTALARDARMYSSGMLADAEDSWLHRMAATIIGKFDRNRPGDAVKLRGLMTEMSRRGMTPEQVSDAVTRELGNKISDPSDVQFLLQEAAKQMEPGAVGASEAGTGSAKAEPAAPGSEGTAGPEGAAPTGEPSTTDLHVNLKYIDADEATKRVIAGINMANAERMAGDRATKGVSEMRAAGRAMLPNLQAAMKWDPTTAPAKELEGGLRALADWRDATSAHARELREQARTDPNVKQDAFRAFVMAGELGARVEAGESLVGRSQRMQQEPSEFTGVAYNPKELMELADNMAATSDVDVDALLDRLDQLTPYQQGVAAKQAVGAMKTGQNAVFEAWINGLLSGPQTHAANIASNAATSLWSIGERGLAEIMPGSKIAHGETAAMVRGGLEGWSDGMRLALETWKSGKDPAGKIGEHEAAITAQNFNLNPESGVGRAVDLLGHAVRLPGRALMSTDAFFKAVNYRMELKALALREATAEGLKGDALDERVAQIEQSPEGQFQKIKASAKQMALINTFTNEMSPAGQKFQAFANSTAAGRLIVPFIRTPTNIATWSVERTPGLQFFSSKLRSDLRSRGPARDLAVAKITAGALTTASVAALAASGHITGGGPDDSALKQLLKDTGWQPYSIKVGDRYYSYNRLDPVGMTLGTIADAGEIMGNLPEHRAKEMAGALVLAVTKNLTSKTYLMGLANALDTVKNPDRAGKSLASGFARSMVPAFVRSIERVSDKEIREARGFLDEIRAGVPGWSKGLPPRRNLFGDPILLTGGLGPDLVSPIYTSSKKNDPVSDEIARVGVRLTMPPEVIFGTRAPGLRMKEQSPREGIELTPQQYDEFVRLAGEPLKKALGDLFKTPSYNSPTNTDGQYGSRAMMIESMVNAYRSGAQAKLLQNHPELIGALRAKTIRNAQALTTTPLRIAP